MTVVAFSEAKARLSEIFDRVEAGEDITVMRRGRPVVELRAVRTPRGRFDAAQLRALTGSMKGPPVDSADFIRELRDGDRY